MIGLHGFGRVRDATANNWAPAFEEPDDLEAILSSMRDELIKAQVAFHLH
jgi:hypothetical protein